MIRRRIARQPEKPWRLQDFRDLPPAAVAQTLSRLTKEGYLVRMSKGVYHHPRPTRFGVSRPSAEALRQLLDQDKIPLFPAGISAANHLGLTTQNAPHGEFATPAASVPLKLLGPRAKVYTRRPEAWKKLNGTEAAILDTLRNRGIYSELTPPETIARICEILRQDRHCQKILEALPSEPPRVQAMFGAILQSCDPENPHLSAIRRRLNPHSHFAFGLFCHLPHASAWQAQ